MHILWRCEINSTRYYSWITRIFDIVKLNIVLFNWLDSEEYFKSTNNLSNKTSISMLVTNYDQYFDMKPKDYEEIILNSRLIKEVKHRKRKSGIIEKEEVLCKRQIWFCNWAVLTFKNTGTQVKNVKKIIYKYFN